MEVSIEQLTVNNFWLSLLDGSHAFSADLLSEFLWQPDKSLQWMSEGVTYQ